MQYNRKPTHEEEKLLEFLVGRVTITLPVDWKEELLVRSMDDGGMGSLLLFPKGELTEKRKFGEQVSEFQFKDQDGVDVIASLNLDDEGNLFELDIWKTDFSPLIKLPDL
jgi:hypothetical protein